MAFARHRTELPVIDYVSMRLDPYADIYPKEPTVIIPTKCQLQSHRTLAEKLKFYLRRMCSFFRKWLRKEAVWLHDLGRIYQEGFFKSSIPAADVLANPRRQPYRKLIWCVVLTPLVYLTISDLRHVVNAYLQYPVIYTYEYKTNTTLEFPDVTICNVNPLVRSRACRKNSILWRKTVVVDKYGRHEILPFCDGHRRVMCQRLCGQNETIHRPNVYDLRIRAELSAWIKETVSVGGAAVQEIYKIGHQINNLLRKCSYGSNDECSRNLTRFTRIVDQFYGTCFCFHCEAKKTSDKRLTADENTVKLETYYEYETLSSPLSGLVLDLRTELQEYLPTSHETGFVAMIREHNKDYSICQDAIYIVPGHTTYVGLNLATTRNLGPPFENSCRDRWPTYLAKGKLDARVKVIHPITLSSQYNRPMCLEYCEIEFLIYICKCIKSNLAVKIHPDLVEDYKFCRTTKKKLCAESTLVNITNKYWQERCDCRPECEMKRYTTDISVSGFMAEESNNNFTDKTHFEELVADMSHARLVVYFHSFTYENIKAMKKYHEARVLSSIGGINGMYLGLSFYLIFQAVDVLVVGAIQFIKDGHAHKFLFGHRRHLMTSTGVQTSSRDEKGEIRNAVGASTRSAAQQEFALYGGARKNIWDVFEKPSEKSKAPIATGHFYRTRSHF